MFRSACFAVALLAAASRMPSRAAACSCSPQVLYDTSPGDGEDDVALNQALIVRGYLDPASLRLEDPEGNTVAVMATHDPGPTCPGTFSELVPKQPLRANTRYVVRAEPTNDPGQRDQKPASFSFSTGTRMLGDWPLERPQGGVSMVSDVTSRLGCGSGKVVACVGGLPEYKNIEVIARKDGAVVMHWFPLEASGTFDFESPPDCIELRRRGPTGQRSEPLTFCGDTLGLRPFRESDGDRYGVVQCENGQIGTPASEPVVSDGDAGLDEPDAGGRSSSDAAAQRDAADAARPPAAPSGGSCSVAQISHGTMAPLALWFLCALGLLRKRPLRGAECHNSLTPHPDPSHIPQRRH